jgi:hypothetical protein
MRLIIRLDGNDLVILGEFSSVYAAQHQKRLNEEMPQTVRSKAKDVIEWANHHENALVTALEHSQTRDEIRRDIELLQQKLAALGG